MKKIFALLFLTTAVLSAMAQSGHAPMKFSGKSTIEVGGSTVATLVSDTVMYSGSDITLPEMRYGNFVIPSFTIHNTDFSMDMSTMTVTFPEQQFTETITVDGISVQDDGDPKTPLNNLWCSVTNDYESMGIIISLLPNDTGKERSCSISCSNSNNSRFGAITVRQNR